MNKKISLLALVALSVVFSGCAGLRTARQQNPEDSVSSSNSSNTASNQELSGVIAEKNSVSELTPEQKIETLTTALSRSQARIEELDAKVSALSDKLEATKISVDNITGVSHSLKTQPIGAAEKSKTESDPETTAPTQSYHSDAATEDFNKAMQLFKNKKYSEAELAFNHITEKYPENIIAGSAQFYAGESYLMMNECKLAINEYSKVLASFSSSPRVASSLVRMAHCHDVAGNTKDALKYASLAKELFEGNPTLDLIKPPTALDTSPIEPNESKKHEDHE